MSIIIKFLLLVQRYFIYIYYLLRDKKIAQNDWFSCFLWGPLNSRCLWFFQNSKFIVLTTATDARDVEPVENAQYAWKDRHLAKDRIADRPYAAILIEGSCKMYQAFITNTDKSWLRFYEPAISSPSSKN